MKKVFFVGIIIFCLSLSGCYLVSEQTQTPVADGTLPTSTVRSTSTATPEIIQTSTLAYTATITLTPTKTLTPTRTPTITQTLTPTQSQTPTQTTTPVPYQLQADSPVYIENFIHADAGCNWMGVAGQVFGEDDSPQLNLVLVVKGMINEISIDMSGVTGVPEADVYGPGGYEIVLADAITQTSDSLTIQVFDLSGHALSEAVAFDTYADCEKNLVIINFQTP